MSRRLALALLAAAAVVVAPAGAAAVSPTVRLSIVHVVQGCHVWADATGVKAFGPTKTLRVKAGTKLVIRVSCPMDFDFVQTAGPKLALGDKRLRTGTQKTILFPRRGTYRLRGKNVQSSAERGLQTLGPDNTLTLIVIAT